MTECNFYMPVHVIQENNCVRQHPEVFKNLGKRALIVTGRKSAEKNGSLDDVITVLREISIEYEIFDEIMSNPTVEVVYRGAEYMKKKKADFVIAIGGGSAMDAAKVIALLFSQDIKEDLLFQGQYQNCLPPMVMIPTTAGTGSEVTQYAILTSDQLKTKISLVSPYFFADTALLDPKYMEDLGKKTTVHTAIDALSHSVEGMLTKKSDSFTDGLAKESMMQISECFDSLVSDGRISTKIREKLLYASTLGGMVIAQTGTTIVHSMGYGLTYFKSVDHGRANGLLLAEFLRLGEQKIPERISEILSSMNLKTVDEFARVLDGLLGEKEVLTEDDIKTYTQINATGKKMNGALFPFTTEDVEMIYRKSLGN